MWVTKIYCVSMYVLLYLDVLLHVILDCVKENNDLISRTRLPVNQGCHGQSIVLWRDVGNGNNVTEDSQQFAHLQTNLCQRIVFCPICPFTDKVKLWGYHFLANLQMIAENNRVFLLLTSTTILSVQRLTNKKVAFCNQSSNPYQVKRSTLSRVNS